MGIDLNTGKEMSIPFSIPQFPHGKAILTNDGTKIIEWSGSIRVFNDIGTSIRVYHLESNDQPLILSGHSKTVHAIDLSIDGKYLATASEDRTIKIWDLESGTCLKTLIGHSGPVYCASFSQDGTQIISGSTHGELIIWNLDTENSYTSLEGHKDFIYAVAFTPDQRRIVSGESYTPYRSPEDLGRLKIWDTNTNKCIATIQEPDWNLPEITNLLLTPDSLQAITCLGKEIYIWNLEVANNKQQMESDYYHTDGIQAVSMTSDSKKIITASRDKNIKIWELSVQGESDQKHANLDLLATLRGHETVVNDIKVTPDDKKLVSCSDSFIKPVDNLILWDLDLLRKESSVKFFSTSMTSLSITLDGRCILVAHNPGIFIWDINAKNILDSWEYFYSWVVAISPANDYFVTNSDHNIIIKPLSNQILPRKIIAHDRYVSSILISPDGKTIISASADSTIKGWEAESGREIFALKGHYNGVTQLSVSSDGKLLASASFDQSIRIWDIEKRQCLAKFVGDNPMTACLFLPDRKTIIVGDRKGQLHILYLENIPDLPPIVTSWSYSLKSVQGRAKRISFGCPHCRTWPEIPHSALGTEISCPNCGRLIRLNPFIVEGDWRRIVKAWKGENIDSTNESTTAMSQVTALEHSSLPAESQLDLHEERKSHPSLVQQVELEGQLLESLAEASHTIFCEGMRARGYHYGSKIDESLKTHNALLPFTELPEDLKKANRLSVRDIPDKLAAAGYSMIPARSNEPGKDLERLAEAEHKRWMQPKLDDGWAYAPQTDKAKKLHKCLVPWEELPEDEKEKDRDMVRGIPEILARAGYAIVKSNG